MVEITGINDRQTLETWLYELPSDRLYPIANVIASRAALRMLPKWHLHFDTDRKDNVTPFYALALFRCSLTSLIAPVLPIDSVKAAAGRAADFAYASDVDAAEAATATASWTAATGQNTGYAATAATAYDLWEIIRQDCQHAFDARDEDYKPAQTHPLWGADKSGPFQEQWEKLSAALLVDSPHWQFWIDLYERFLRGEAQNWDMLLEIVLLKDEDWQQGPEHLNGLIAGVVERYRQAEKIKQSEPAPETNVTSLARKRAEQLVRVGPVSIQIAETTAVALGSGVTRILVELGNPNELPEPLQPLGGLAASTRKIEMLLEQQGNDTYKIRALELELANLKGQLAELRWRMAKDENKKYRGHLMLAFVGALGVASADRVVSGLEYLGRGVIEAADLDWFEQVAAEALETPAGQFQARDPGNKTGPIEPSGTPKTN